MEEARIPDCNWTLVHIREFYFWHCRPDQKSMTEKVIVLRWEPTDVILLNNHVVELPFLKNVFIPVHMS